MTYAVLATYTAGQFHGLIGASGYFLRAGSPLRSNDVADLLTLYGVTPNVFFGISGV